MTSMRRPFDPGPPPAAIPAHLGEVPKTLFDERLWAASELVERYATDLALEIAGTLGLAAALESPRSASELAEDHGWSPGFEPALAALLARLEQAGLLRAEDRAGGGLAFAIDSPLPPSDRAALRDRAEAIEPAIRASLDLLDAAAELYPGVAAGSIDAEHELLAPARVPLWLAYFSNENRPYALANRIAAVAAANRLPGDRPFRILEVGAGAGSAALALLDELERRGRLDEVERYELTEPHPFFLRRAERAIRGLFPRLKIAARALDVDQPPAPEKEERGADLLLGVNVLHVAERLPAALAALRQLLAPGGAIVLGECLPSCPRQVVAADLVFQLFAGFTGVETDPELRPRHGFLVPETWSRLLAAAGYGSIEVVPDLARLHEIHPGFVTGAMCARRLP